MSFPQNDLKKNIRALEMVQEAVDGLYVHLKEIPVPKGFDAGRYVKMTTNNHVMALLHRLIACEYMDHKSNVGVSMDLETTEINSRVFDEILHREVFVQTSSRDRAPMVDWFVNAIYRHLQPEAYAGLREWLRPQ